MRNAAAGFVGSIPAEVVLQNGEPGPVKVLIDEIEIERTEAVLLLPTVRDAIPNPTLVWWKHAAAKRESPAVVNEHPARIRHHQHIRHDAATTQGERPATHVNVAGVRGVGDVEYPAGDGDLADGVGQTIADDEAVVHRDLSARNTERAGVGGVVGGNHHVARHYDSAGRSHLSGVAVAEHKQPVRRQQLATGDPHRPGAAVAHD